MGSKRTEFNGAYLSGIDLASRSDCSLVVAGESKVDDVNFVGGILIAHQYIFGL